MFFLIFRITKPVYLVIHIFFTPFFYSFFSSTEENSIPCSGRAYAIRQDNFGAADVCHAHKIKSNLHIWPFVALDFAVVSPTFFGPPVICWSQSVSSPIWSFGQTNDQAKKPQKQMSNVKASILIFSAQKVPKVRSDLLSYFYTYDFQCYWVFCSKTNTRQTFFLISFLQNPPASKLSLICIK